MELSKAYGLACRLMALVAVVERPGDKPGAPPVTRVVPVGMPQDVDFDSYFAGTGPRPDANVFYCLEPSLPRLSKRAHLRVPADLSMAEPPDESGAELMALASRIQPDGGMPGAVDEERALATVLALLRFLAEGNTARRGAFREHVRRLMEFLEKPRCRTMLSKPSSAGCARGSPSKASYGNVCPSRRSGPSSPRRWRSRMEICLEKTNRVLRVLFSDPELAKKHFEGESF